MQQNNEIPVYKTQARKIDLTSWLMIIILIIIAISIFWFFWNWLMVDIFSLRKITFLESAGLLTFWFYLKLFKIHF